MDHVSLRSSPVAMKEALDTFLYSLPDLGLAGFGSAAAGSRQDHFRGNEIEELACADSRIHFAQSSSCHLLIKVTSKRATHSLTTVRAQALSPVRESALFPSSSCAERKWNLPRGRDPGTVHRTQPKPFPAVSWVSRTAESSPATILAPRITTALNRSSFPGK